MKNTILYITTACIALLLTSCQDDYWDKVNGYGGEGTGRVTVTLDYEPLSGTTLSRGTVAPPGDGIGALDDLVIVIFSSDGNYVDAIPVDNLDAVTKMVDRTDADASNGHLAGETSTARVQLDLTLSSGSYYMYAVANLGGYSGSTRTGSTIDVLNAMDVSRMTRQQFRAMRRVWDPNNYRNNMEMTGIFTNAAADGSYPQSSSPMEDTTVSIAPGARVHCWLRRLVSKVTVDFDASALSPGTTIYLKDIRLLDIPYDCPLLDSNTPTADHETAGGLMDNSRSSHHIQLAPDVAGKPAADYRQWPALTATDNTLAAIARSNSTFGYLANVNHDNASKALFFYENLQGRGESKLQDADNDGVIDSPDSFHPDADHYKDNKPAGSYIEVTAYYKSLDEGNESSGDITYRFMLGKNVTDNYDCERNHHYRLTLKFNGFANDVDWHIEFDYTHQPPVTIPTPYYISYGYNEKLEMPLRFMGQLVGDTINAEIVRNDWWPSTMWEDTPAPQDEFFPDSKVAYHSKDKNKLYFGFLSLRMPQNEAVGTQYGSANEVSMNYFHHLWQGTTDNDANNTDYIRSKYGGKRPLGSRRFYINPNDPKGVTEYDYDENNDSHDGAYRTYVANVGTDNTPRMTTVYIPLFTRERNIIKVHGYTGENPYNNNQRRAQVRYRFKVRDLNGNTIPVDTTVDIIQVAKIANPLAIWRDWDECHPFEVELKYLTTPSSTDFTTLVSKGGGWSAEVDQGKEWILLNGGKRTVYGNQGDPIRFTYRPAGILSSSKQCRYGRIKILYHNYSCVHYIYVRQGYAPSQIIDNGKWWHTFNMETGTTEVKSPCDEGSLFKWLNPSMPIASSNQVNDKIPWVNYNYNSFKSHANDDFVIAGSTTTQKWNLITSKNAGTETWANVTINGVTCHVATIDNICSLRDGGPGNTTRHQYGMLYDGSSTKTADNIADAWGYKTGDKGRGMRGDLVYNIENSRQLFFPIGSTGYGKRKQGGTNVYTPGLVPDWQSYQGNRPTIGDAVLRYGNNRITNMNDAAAMKMPLLWDIYRRPGANYWAQGKGTDPKLTGESRDTRYCLDINYFTFDFNTMGTEPFVDYNNTNKRYSDAMFLRLVQDTAP